MADVPWASMIRTAALPYGRLKYLPLKRDSALVSPEAGSQAPLIIGTRVPSTA